MILYFTFFAYTRLRRTADQCLFHDVTASQSTWSLVTHVPVSTRDVRILYFSVRICPQTSTKDPRPQSVVVCDPLSVRKCATFQYISSTLRLQSANYYAPTINHTPCALHCPACRCRRQGSCTVIRHCPLRNPPRGTTFMSDVHFTLRNCDPRQSASATFSEKSVRCQSTEPKIHADLRPQADASAVRTPLVSSACRRHLA